MRRVLILSIILTVGILFVPSNVRAQENFCNSLPTIAYGDTVTGTITNSSSLLGYCFDGQTGDTITITMTATSGDLDPYLGLADNTFQTVYAENDDATGSDSQIIFTLTTSGQYMIVATRYDLENGSTTGNFSLTLTSTGSGSKTGTDTVGVGLGGRTEETEDVSIYVTCDTGEEIRGGVQFSFINVNPGFPYTATAIGIDGFNPVIAVETQPGIGTCNDDERAATGSIVTVPSIGDITATARSAQVRFTTPRRGFPVNITVGSSDDSSGSFVLVIEGFVISPSTELDGFSIRVPSQVADLPIGVYMVSQRTNLNPYIAVGDGEGLNQAYVDGSFDPALVDFDNITYPLFECDDLGVAECSDITPFPVGGVIDIANGSRYVTGDVDAGLVIRPITSDPILYVFSSSGGQSSGEYAILIVGNTPEASQ